MQQPYIIASKYDSSDDEDTTERRLVADNVENLNSRPILGSETSTTKDRAQIGGKMDNELDNNNDPVDQDSHSEDNENTIVIKTTVFTLVVYRLYILLAFFMIILSSIIFGLNNNQVPRSLAYGDIRASSLTVLTINCVIFLTGLMTSGYSYFIRKKPDYLSRSSLLRVIYIEFASLVHVISLVFGIFTFVYVTYVPALLENHYEYLTNHDAFKLSGLMLESRLFTFIGMTAFTQMFVLLLFTFVIMTRPFRLLLLIVKSLTNSEAYSALEEERA